MNSFSHYAHGAVGAFIFGHVGGIRSESPGYKNIVIKPVIQPGLSWAETAYDSIQGRISTCWKVENGKVDMGVHIPANATAKVFVPAKDPAVVLESGKPAGSVDGIKSLGTEGNTAVFEVGSGTYRFQSEIP